MSEANYLNPLTYARIRGNDGSPALELRSFARGRSLLNNTIARSEHPELYDLLRDSLADGTPVPAPKPQTRSGRMAGVSSPTCSPRPNSP